MNDWKSCCTSNRKRSHKQVYNIHLMSYHQCDLKPFWSYQVRVPWHSARWHLAKWYLTWWHSAQRHIDNLHNSIKYIYTYKNGYFHKDSQHVDITTTIIIMTFSLTSLGITTFIIITLGLKTFNVLALIVTHSNNQYNNSQCEARSLAWVEGSRENVQGYFRQLPSTSVFGFNTSKHAETGS